MKEYAITPVPKPRMTQRDKWKKRPVVLRYHAFKDEVRAAGVELEESGQHIIFVLPMPKSWSKKKQREMVGKPHQQKPDKDNLEKALERLRNILRQSAGMNATTLNRPIHRGTVDETKFLT